MVQLPLLVNPRPRVGGRRVIVVGLCVCVCVCPSVRPSVRPSIVFLENGGSSERQTWTCYEVGGLHLKIRLWSEEAQGS